MKNLSEIPNYRQIKCQYVPPTNEKGSRIRIFETNRFNNDEPESKFFSYDSEIDSVIEQSLGILTKNGFNVVCRASENNYYIFLCNNWAEDFKHVKDLTK